MQQKSIQDFFSITYASSSKQIVQPQVAEEINGAFEAILANGIPTTKKLFESSLKTYLG